MLARPVSPSRPNGAVPIRRTATLGVYFLCRWAVVSLSWVAISPGLLPAQGPDYLRQHYTKREYQIPMRDGTRLFTAVYAPRDASRTYPLLLFRTQSGILPYGEDQFPAQLGPAAQFARAGYIFAYQDIRGRYMSEGKFVVLRPHVPHKSGPAVVDESSDTYDTIAWLLSHVPGHNGRAGLYGTSYRGWLAAAGAIDAHPALKAVSPQAPIGDCFVGDDWHHNGALFLNHTFFYTPLKGGPRTGPSPLPLPRPDYGTPDGYDFFLRLGPLKNVDARYFQGKYPYWADLVSHGTYDDFWKSVRLLPHLKDLKPALLITGGWFDAEDLYGTLATYQQIEQANPDTTSTLVMGPWIHGGWNDAKVDGSSLGAVAFNSPTATYYREQIEFPFFEYHLKDQGRFAPPEALVFETGANQWHKLDRWPPPDTQVWTIYLHPRGRLDGSPPANGATPSYDEFVSDPARPVPYTDKIGFRLLPEYMVGDQRFAATRPDVLVYESEPLTEKLTLAGPLWADLMVSTSGTDSDWIVKLIDVYTHNMPDPNPNPAGIRLGNYQQLVRAEVMRGKFRRSLERPEPFVPDEPTNVRIQLPDLYHTFLPGHKLMVQVQCTWFPLVDRNPQTFVDIYHADESDFRSARQRLFHAGPGNSRLTAQRLDAN